MKVYKYQLNKFEPVQFLELPLGSSILSVLNQYEELVVYALVHESAINQAHKLDVMMTGQDFDLPPKGRFVGTVGFQSNRYVIHVFEENPEKC
jgi:hypothetical protein